MKPQDARVAEEILRFALFKEVLRRQHRKKRKLNNGAVVTHDEDDEDDDAEDESDESDEDLPTPQETSPMENEAMFLKIVKERFIYGFLEVHTYIILACGLLLIISSGYQSIDYDKVDWDGRWDGDLDRDAEERWFDDEEED